jgi:hypothetical protein
MTIENDEMVQLRRDLDNLLRMKGAHISLRDAIADFPAALRGAKPAGAPHTPWELLEHIRIAQEDILDFARNPDWRRLKFPDDYWPSAAAPPSDEAWDHSLAQFERDLQDLCALAADAGNNLFSKIPHGSGQTLLREALIAGAHNAYHVGQFVLLRQILEAR